MGSVPLGFLRKGCFGSWLPSPDKAHVDSSTGPPQHLKKPIDVLGFVVHVRSNSNRIATDAYKYARFFEGLWQVDGNRPARTYSDHVRRPIRGWQDCIIKLPCQVRGPFRKN